MPKISHLQQVIFEAIEQFNEESPDNPDLELELSTPLFGPESELDSLGLVNLLLTVEQRLHDEFVVNVSIADEKALSLENSPFRTVETLRDYTKTLMDEKDHD
jgi:acyl carrier protein